MNSPTLLDDIIRTAAKNYPAKIALVGADGEFTYAQLDALAEQFACVLQHKGVTRGDRVAVYLDKNAESVIIFQGILRAGAIYVPIDLQVPIHGVVDILQRCTPKAIFTTERLGDAIQQEYSEDLHYLTTPTPGCQQFSWDEVLGTVQGRSLSVVEKNADDPAYMLYTSGSTGKPKGVCLSHENGLAFIRWAAEITELSENSIVANHAPFSFGISVYDLYAPFLKGASLTIVPARLFLSGRDMTEFIVKQGVTHWYSVPSAIMLMMRAANFADHVKDTLEHLMFAGEPFPTEKLNELRGQLPSTRMWNFYGATETNVSCFHEVTAPVADRTASVPIGKASCGNRVWIEKADEKDDEGELVVAGPTVMLGYWGEPLTSDLTYHTNDIVRQDDHDVLHFIGRNDTIVKVRGYRVSLTEVEDVLRLHASIHSVAVVQVGDSSTGKLYAYATLAESQRTPTLIEIKELCAEHLPPYKIVHRIKILESLPLNVNGKIDRASLIAMAT